MCQSRNVSSAPQACTNLKARDCALPPSLTRPNPTCADGEGADAESSEQGRLVEAMKTEVLRLSRGNNNGGGGDGRKGGGTTGGKKGKGASSSTAATTSLSAPGAPAGTTGPSTATASANSDGAPRTDSDAEVSAALADIMSAFILRRTKGTVDLSLPPKTRVTEWVSPTPTQRAIADTLHGVTLALAPRGGLGQAIREALDAAGADSGADAAAGAEGGDSGSGVATGDPAVERLGDGGDAMSVPPQTPLQRAPQHPMSTGAQGRNEEAPPTVLGEGPGGAAAPPGVATEDEAAPPMLPRVSARGMASPSALAPPSSPTTTLGPVFIGDLSRVLSDSDAPGSGDSGVGLDATPHPSPTGAAGATSTSSGVTGQVGRVVMLLRKAANHPLLLRARYSDAAALAAAGIVWDASRDLEPRMPDLRALGFTAGLGGGGGGGAARGGKNSKRAALAAPATEAGPLAGSGLRLVPARDDGSSSSSSSPSSDVSVAAAAFVADPSRALAEVLATAGRDSAAASGSSDTTSAIGDAGQALLRAVAAAHTPLSRPELLAWARTHLGPAPDASAPPAKSGGATGRGASSSSAAAGASTSSAASKGHEKAVKGLADLAESYLACSVSGIADVLCCCCGTPLSLLAWSAVQTFACLDAGAGVTSSLPPHPPLANWCSQDYQLHCALAEWAPTCPAAAALTLPEGAFLDSGKVLFLRNLIDHLQRKPQEASASAATDGSGRARGAGAATSPGSSRGAVVRYASRVLVFSQFTQVLDILEAALGVLGHDYRRIDGSTAAAQRQVRDCRPTDECSRGRGAWGSLSRINLPTFASPVLTHTSPSHMCTHDRASPRRPSSTTSAGATTCRSCCCPRAQEAWGST